LYPAGIDDFELPRPDRLWPIPPSGPAPPGGVGSGALRGWLAARIVGKSGDRAMRNVQREKFERLTVRVKATLRQDVERLADEDELSVAAYVRRLIAAHVKSVGATAAAAWDRGRSFSASRSARPGVTYETIASGERCKPERKRRMSDLGLDTALDSDDPRLLKYRALAKEIGETQEFVMKTVSLDGRGAVERIPPAHDQHAVFAWEIQTRFKAFVLVFCIMVKRFLVGELGPDGDRQAPAQSSCARSALRPIAGSSKSNVW
jgi:hypothetical protein